jgi:hypothetical protein
MLSDHWNEGNAGKYLQEGWHRVKVIEHECFQYNSGSDGVKFTLADSAGRIAKLAICLHPKSLWKLAAFADRCGMTKEDAAKYDETNQGHHTKLHNRTLVVLVKKVGQYHEVSDDIADWLKADQEPPSFQRPVDNGVVEAPVIDESQIPF